MLELRFQILVRRKGRPVHDSNKYATEEYKDLDELLDAVEHYIRVQVEDEEEYLYRNEGSDE